jgi:hypothetical protein
MPKVVVAASDAVAVAAGTSSSFDQPRRFKGTPLGGTVPRGFAAYRKRCDIMLSFLFFSMAIQQGSVIPTV